MVNYLDKWSTLNKHLHDLDEKTILGLIKLEKEGACRPAFLLRLYGRYNRLRTARERQELITGDKV